MIPTLRVPFRPADGTRFCPTGGGFYSGSLGIALALSEVHSLTGDARVKSFAQGALRHSFECRDSLGLSFHVGDVGRIWVSKRVSILLKDDEWFERAIKRVDTFASLVRKDVALDVIGGSAGAIPPLLSIAESESSLDVLSDIALLAGNRISALATRRMEGWSWGVGQRAQTQDLCGYGHGASGFAHAFLELFAATGDARWQFAAQRALEYEEYQRTRHGGQWPDFRSLEIAALLTAGVDRGELVKVLRKRRRTKRESNDFMQAWCHGAAGAALVRQRAVQLGVPCSSSLLAAELQTEASLSVMEANGSICHGFLGNLDVLWRSNRGSHALVSSLLQQWLEKTLARYGVDGTRWPSGGPGAAFDPSFMLGIAGMLHSLLRFSGCEVPAAHFVTLSRRASPLDSYDDLKAEIEADVKASAPRTSRLAAELGVVRPPELWRSGSSARKAVSSTIARTEEAVQSRSPLLAKATIRQDRAFRRVRRNHLDHLEGLLLSEPAAEALTRSSAVQRAPGLTLVGGSDTTGHTSGASVSDLLLARSARDVALTEISSLEAAILALVPSRPTSVEAVLSRFYRKFAVTDDENHRVDDAIIRFIGIAIEQRWLTTRDPRVDNDT